MQATTIGIDLTKHVFQLHGVDQHGKTVLTRKLKRDQMMAFFANHPSCLIGQGKITKARDFKGLPGRLFFELILVGV